MKKSKLLFPLIVFGVAAAFTHVLFPDYLLQDPLVLFTVAVALIAARRGFFAGIIAGGVGAIYSAYLTSQGPFGTPYLSITLFLFASLLISFHLGKRFRIEQNLRREVEERKKIESHLDAQEARLSAIVESSGDAIISETLEGLVMTWNDSARRIFGYTAEEAVGRHIAFLTPRHRHREAHEIIEAVRNGQELFQLDTTRLHKSGREISVSVSVSPVKNAEGVLVGFSKIARDITLSKKAQERERFLFEASELLVNSLDYEASLAEVGSRSIPRIADWCAIYVEHEGEIRRIALAHENPSEIEIARKLEDEYKQNKVPNEGVHLAMAQGKVQIFPKLEEADLKPFSESELHFENMKRLNLKSSLVVPLHAHGRSIGLVIFTSSKEGKEFTEADRGFAEELGRRASLAIENARNYYDAEKAIARYERELAERSRIEQELRRAKEAADESNRTKSAFLANMSHEIRTPLGAILGFSELLVTTEQSPADRQESLEVITRNGNLLSNIINDILDLTRVESGRLEVETLSVPLVNLFEETRSSLSLLASEKGIQLDLQFASDLPQSIITDPLRLKQILINVIGNAIKFTAVGGVLVSLRLQRRLDATDLLQIDVKDSGKGVAPDEEDKLFRVFSQGDVSTTRKFGGAGLGLVLSRQLARALGGDVRLLESRVGEGSTFQIEIDTGLKSVEKKKNARTSLSPSESESFRYNATQKPLEGVRVLVVEDAKDNQLLLSRILKVDGACFDIAENGAVGVDKALGGIYDVILMDVQMPVKDGFEAMLELRSAGYTKPIIALTAHAMREDREKCLERGFNDHMSKPIDRVKLRELITFHLNQSRHMQAEIDAMFHVEN